MSCALL